MNITVFCEHNASMDSEEGKVAYPEGFGNCLAALFAQNGKNKVTLIGMDETGVIGFSDKAVDSADVFVWWGHWYHEKVSDEIVKKITDRVHRGAGAIFLHSAHMAKPFRALMGTSCSLIWREDGEQERLWCVNPSHPIAAGLGEYVDIPQEEMYGEFFDIPTPDELVYVGWFRGGEIFRGGCVFNRGRGKVFYFNPGHETYPTYKVEAVQKLLSQAADYVCPKTVIDKIECRHAEKFSIDR